MKQANQNLIIQTTWYKNPSFTKYKNPSSTKYKNPSFTKYKNPSSTKYKNPSFTKYKNPSFTKYKNHSSTSHDIHRLSPDGTFRDIVLSKHDGVDDPRSITFNNDFTKLFIINNRGSWYVVSIYNVAI
jgi:hypothetical protein